MLKLNSFDTICHEHLEYYSLHSLDYLMSKHDLKILRSLKTILTVVVSDVLLHTKKI